MEVDCPTLKRGEVKQLRDALRAYERGEGRRSASQQAIGMRVAKALPKSTNARYMGRRARAQAAREKAVQRSKEWRLQNPEKHRQHVLQWAKLHPEQKRAINQRHKLKKEKH